MAAFHVTKLNLNKEQATKDQIVSKRTAIQFLQKMYSSKLFTEIVQQYNLYSKCRAVNSWQ